MGDIRVDRADDDAEMAPVLVWQRDTVALSLTEMEAFKLGFELISSSSLPTWLGRLATLEASEFRRELCDVLRTLLDEIDTPPRTGGNPFETRDPFDIMQSVIDEIAPSTKSPKKGGKNR